jgi:hypothetical protein
MTDVYRNSAIACPNCPGASLREFQQRYVCDECEGLLIGFDDFIAACADLSGDLGTLAYRDDVPTTKPCPLCERALTGCKVTLAGNETFKLKDDFLRCDRHGLWCGGGVLTRTFARVRRHTYNSSNRRPHATAMDGLPDRSYEPATAGLAIGNWHRRRRARTKTLTPINAYADRELACPACRTRLSFMGDRWGCGACAGMFVENAALVDMVSDIAKAPWQLPPVTGALGARTCPVCSKALVTEKLERLEIDRCATHGIWFDGGELAASLERASGAFDTGLGAWLKRLFS